MWGVSITKGQHSSKNMCSYIQMLILIWTLELTIEPIGQSLCGTFKMAVSSQSLTCQRAVQEDRTYLGL